MNYTTTKGETEVLGKMDLIREDGRVEGLCKHGVGHPIGHIKKNGWDPKWMGVHGCDGCCSLAGFWLRNHKQNKQM